MVAPCGARPCCSRFLVGGGAGWFGRGAWEGAGPARAVTAEAFEAHRLYIAEVRHPIEVKAGESHLNRWLSRRVGYELPTPNLDAFGLKLLGGRLLPGNAGRPAALYMYEGTTGERFTIYCRRDQAPQTALRYRAAGPVGSVFWVEDEVAFVVSGPADRARLQKVAEAVYEQIETRQQTGAMLAPCCPTRALAEYAANSNSAAHLAQIRLRGSYGFSSRHFSISSSSSASLPSGSTMRTVA